MYRALVALAFPALTALALPEFWKEARNETSAYWKDAHSAEEENSNASLQRNTSNSTDSVNLALKTKMPFYVILACFPVKFAIILLALGVDKVDQEKGCLAKLLLWFIFYLTIVVAVQDFYEIKDTIGNTTYSNWEKANRFALTCGTSSNVLTLGMLVFLPLLTSTAADWRRTHGLPLQTESATRSKMLPGTLSCFLYVGIIGLVLYGFVILYCIPAILAYFFISVPAWLLIRALQSRVAELVFRSRKSSDREPIMQMQTEAKVRTLMIDGGEAAAKSYERDATYFLVAGAPYRGWFAYVFWPLAFSMVPLFVTLAVSLYSGQGYLAAVVLTFGKGHGNVYFKSLINSTSEASGSQLATHEILCLICRWLVCISYLV